MLKPKPSIEKMDPYITPGEGRMDALRLDFNENLFGPSPKVLEALRNIAREAYGFYPEYGQLVSALSNFLNVPKECILPTNGSDEAIRALFDTYVEKADKVILLSPSYSMYELYAQVAGAQIVWVKYNFDDFSFPIEEVIQAIEPDTRLIALANPNNPTGTLIKREELLKIIQANPSMAVLIDEAYAPFAKETNLDIAAEYANVFVTQTFSKAYGLAALRIGYLVSAKENIQQVSRVLAPSYSVNCAAAVAAMAAMEDQAYLDAYVEQVNSVKAQFCRKISALGFQPVESHANFVLINFGTRARAIKEELAQHKILVRDRADLEGYLRISIGSASQMQKVIDVLNDKKGLIFDMDGVLVDESQSYRPCIAKTAEYFLGKKIDSKTVERLKQQGGYNNDYDCVEAVLKEHGLVLERKEIVELFDLLYHQEFKFAEKWLLDEPLLLKLKQKFHLGIFTGRPKKDAWDALQRFDKASLFEVVITDDDVLRKKPDPEGLIAAIERLQVTQAVYFGDSKDDREAARRAAVPFVKVTPAGGNISEMLESFL